MNHGSPGISRRTFVVTTLSTGFALAVSPVSAGTIATDSEGLIAGEVKIPTKDGEVPAYRAKPAKAAHPPVILVVQEVFGVHEHIKDVCRRFAKLGYLAIATELYARQGDVAKLGSLDEIRAVVAKVPDAQVMSDLDATLAFAKKDGGDDARAAVVGFCWGGRIVWLYAAHNTKLRAGGAFYGRLASTPDELHPKNPVDVAASLTVPVLGFYGGADEGIPIATIDQMRKALPWPKNPSEILVYTDAPHGFFADYRPTYRSVPAEDAWKRLGGFLKKNGV